MWEIADSRSGQLATTAIYRTAESAEQQIDAWVDRLLAGERSDVTAEMLAHLVPRQVEASAARMSA